MPYFKEPCIYKICCKDPEIKDCYVGSTTNFGKRKWDHKNNTLKSNYYVYQFIREHGGWDNWDMVLMEKVDINDRRELHAKEREWFEKLGASLNYQVPNRSKKEWFQDNAERQKDRMKKYNLENKEKIAETQRKKYLKNKENYAEKGKKYYLENKEKIDERMNEKITCECGVISLKGNLVRHRESKKHADLMAQLNEE